MSEEQGGPLVIQPKMPFLLLLLRSLLWLIPEVFLTVYVGIRLQENDAFARSLYTMTPWLCMFFWLILNFVYFSLQSRSYVASNYKLSANELEYSEGFLTKVNKNIPLKNVREVSLRRTIPQRIFGLGTIVLLTAASTGRRWSGIGINDVENSENLYVVVRDLIDKASRPMSRLTTRCSRRLPLLRSVRRG
jgi:uncharacterized membrane protein YdbT with pleckstrin-like domain